MISQNRKSKLKDFKSLFLLITFCLLLPTFMGCATYKFHHGQAPYNKGYVVSRDDYTILEYTLGKDNTVPKIKLAKERFHRRRNIVEDYYKRMGLIENRFKMAVWDPCIYVVKLVGGLFYLPFYAVSDFRAGHNPQYKERLRKIDEGKEAKEEARIKSLKDKLYKYIDIDLAKEPPAEPAKEVVAQRVESPTPGPAQPQQETPAQAPAVVSATTEPPKQEMRPQPQEIASPAKDEPKTNVEEPKPAVQEEEPAKDLSQDIKVVIVAKPIKGYSPLKVKFYGTQSHSPHGRIVSYQWNFGDGDKSTKPNPSNTYWSATYGSTPFTATLTVQDDKGNTSTASTVIEVMTK